MKAPRYLRSAPGHRKRLDTAIPSSKTIDTREKLRVYRRNGVREYITWRTGDRALDWRWLVEGDYQSLAPNREGLLQSRIFPGLCLHVEALLAKNAAQVLAAQNAQLGTPAHAEFIARLATHRKQ